jgi:YihY family inner membrane protein
VEQPLRLLRSFDAWQQRSPIVGPGVAVFRKFKDDDGNALAVALAWYGFVAISPLLLLVVTIFGFIGAESLGDKVVSTLQQFPVIGSAFTSGEGASNLHGSGLGLAIGAIGLLYGAMGVTRSGQRMMARVWSVPTDRQATIGGKLVRGFAGLLVIGVAFLVTAVVSGMVTATGSLLVARVLLLIGLVVANAGFYLVTFFVFTPPDTVTWRPLVPGATLAGTGFTLLTTLGTGLVQHQLKHTSDTYGAFASVIGVVTYLLLLATLTVYAAELNVVLDRRLWPRSLLREPEPAV